MYNDRLRLPLLIFVHLNFDIYDYLNLLFSVAHTLYVLFSLFCIFFPLPVSPTLISLFVLFLMYIPLSVLVYSTPYKCPTPYRWLFVFSLFVFVLLFVYIIFSPYTSHFQTPYSLDNLV